MYPITISDVISAIEKGTLTSDEHVEICGIPRNYSLLVRKMVSLANSGGGVAVLGLALDKVHKTWVKRITPINTRELKIRITEEIIGRVKNMGDWRIDSGDCRGSVVSAIFVAPSSKGMSYIYSSSDPLNRSYVYRKHSVNPV